MKRFFCFTFSAIALLAIACTKISPDSSEMMALDEPIASYKVSLEEAVTTLEDFLSSYSNTIPTKGESSLSGRVVSDVKALRNNNFATKSAEDPILDIGIDTLMYAINFADEKGFALLAADKRTEPILAIIEEGSFDEKNLQEGKDNGFLLFLERAIGMMCEDILNYDENISTKALVTNGYTITSQYGPLLHTKWNQGGVYGRYCPNGVGGCVAIAVAQILSYYQTPNNVNWSYNGTGGSATLHWEQIIADCDSHNGRLTSSDCATSGNEVAHLIRYLGAAMNADYSDPEETGIARNKPIKWFNDWSTLTATNLSDYNQSLVMSAIRNRRPVYARGNAGRIRFLGITWSYTEGHAWVYDGVIRATKNGIGSDFIHCNWGWNGSKNGYYLGNVFDTTIGATIYDDSEPQTGPECNFQYNLQYSIISQ